MVCPMFREDYENKSFEELVKERQKLIKRMLEYENTYIFESKQDDSNKLENIDLIVNPSPDVIWSVDNENLIMLTQLIEENRQKEMFK